MLSVAIIGKPNVGKSTLFNRLVGRTHSIVSPVEGVTRDRIYGTVDWLENKFNLIDTGGFLPDSIDTINTHVRDQANLALDESDLILFVVDGRQGPTSPDKYLAQELIKSGKKYIFVINKVDDQVLDETAFEFYELGLDEYIVISAQNKRNIDVLLDNIITHIPSSNKQSKVDNSIGIALIGIPNAGKSSIMNKLIKEDKSIVTNIAGTTRDSVDSYIKYYGKTFKLIDTAGLRKKSKVDSNIEFYSTVRTYRSIAECQIAVVVLDASKGFNRQDRDIVRHVINSGKGLILVINKWDLIEKDTNTYNDFKQDIFVPFPSVEHYPTISISALHNLRVGNILKEAASISKRIQTKIKTSDLNKFLEFVQRKYPHPISGGKNVKFKYVSQVDTVPPLFAFFSNFPKLVSVQYKRYLENQLRENFDFDGVPIKITFKQK